MAKSPNTRRFIYSEHKSGPIGVSERGGANASAPIELLEGLNDFKVSSWNIRGPVSSPTLIGLGWTNTAINVGTATLSIDANHILTADGGIVDTAGGNLQYVAPADVSPLLFGAFPAQAISSTSPAGATLIFNYRAGFTTSTATFPAGCGIFFGLCSSNTAILTSAGALSVAACMGFYASSAGVAGVSGAAGAANTSILTPVVATTSKLTCPYNLYSIRLEKGSGLNSATSVAFYLNGILKATHTTGLPNLVTSERLSFTCVNPAGVDNVAVNLDHISWAQTRYGYAN